MNESVTNQSRCWVTLLTKASYLPGVVILAHSIDKHRSCIPLVVQYTTSLGHEGTEALRCEAQRSGRILPLHVEPLLPREGQENVAAVAERFKDTFTKLRAFEVYKLGFTKACFLDADMAAFQNPDSIFNHLPLENDWIAANHPCVCNPDRNEWAPSNWKRSNCAYTKLACSDRIDGSTQEGTPSTYELINGGMFLFHPSARLWTDLMQCFDTSEKLKDYQFPDQDFLADFFLGKRVTTSWKYNALKTMRYVHPALWSDNDVVFLHYIVDKPWECRVSADGISGHLGRDGKTHSWWWELYDDWLGAQKASDLGTAESVQKFVNFRPSTKRRTPLPPLFEDLKNEAP